MPSQTVANFCRALWQTDAKTVARLAHCVDPNGHDRWGNSPLLMAARCGDLTLVKLLIERGATANQGRAHLTPITLAARRGAYDIVKFLRGKRAAISILTSLYLADRNRVARELKRNPALAQLRDEEGTPIPHHAAESLHGQMLKLLLKHGAKIDDTDPNGETALHRVADLRSPKPKAAAAMAKLLLDRGAAVNARNWDDVTPLHQAVRARNQAVVKVLLSRGADVNARDKGRGSTPLRRAVSNSGAGGTAGKSDIMLPLVRLLLKHGADPNVKDKRGQTILASTKNPAIRDELQNQHRAKARK